MASPAFEPKPQRGRRSPWSRNQRLSLAGIIVAGPLTLALVLVGAATWLDTHRTTTIATKDDERKTLSATISDEINKNTKIDGMKTSLDRLVGKVGTLEDLVVKHLAPQVKGISLKQETLGTRQQNLMRRVDGSISIAKLMDPGRILATIRAELRLANDLKKALPDSQLADYKSAVRVLPASAHEFWATVAAIVNYQSMLDQMSGHAPDPLKVSHPCDIFTANPAFTNNTVVGPPGGFPVRDCVIDLDSSNVFDNITFLDCVVRYNYQRPVSSRRLRFINCRFELGQTPGNDLAPEETVLLRALLDSPDQSKVSVGT